MDQPYGPHFSTADCHQVDGTPASSSSSSKQPWEVAKEKKEAAAAAAKAAEPKKKGFKFGEAARSQQGALRRI